MHRAGWLGYEKQFMESYYYFEAGEKIFIGIDSEVYKQSYDVAIEKRLEQNQWLETLFTRLPKTQVKTVFMHTPLYIEHPEEVESAEKGIDKSTFPDFYYYIPRRVSSNRTTILFARFIR